MELGKILQTVGRSVIGRPFIVFWNIINKCNLRCKYCSVPLSGIEELSTGQALDAVGKMADMGITMVNMDGGEPLIRPDLERIAEACRKHGMVVYLNTNGTLVDKERARKLVKVFNEICVSIDGFEALNDAGRGKGAFKRAIKGLETLIEANEESGHGCLVGTNTVITKYNAVGIEDFMRFMHGRGSDFFIFSPVNDPYPYDIETPKVSRDLYPSRKDSTAATEAILRMKSEDASFIAVSGKYIKLMAMHFSSGVKICDAGILSLFMDAAGRVCACPRFRKPLFMIKDGDAALQFKKLRALHGEELKKVKSACPGCMMGCTTEISIRCKFPSSVVQTLKNMSVLAEAMRNDELKKQER